LEEILAAQRIAIADAEWGMSKDAAPTCVVLGSESFKSMSEQK
jgi:hypothetical protein